MHKDFILGSINSKEKCGASDGSLIEGVCCWGSSHVEGHCFSVCLFDCRLVDLCLGRGQDYILTVQVGNGGGGGARGAGEVGQR